MRKTRLKQLRETWNPLTPKADRKLKRAYTRNGDIGRKAMRKRWGITKSGIIIPYPGEA